MNAQIAALINRPELISAPVDPYGGTSNNSPLRAAVGISGGIGATRADASGRLTAGMLGLMVIGVVAFYVWTRPLQA